MKIHLPLAHLPIDDVLSELTSALQVKQNLVLIAEPGAGKTTRIPPALLSLTDKKILMLQPRRIAARASAERIAEENLWTLGKEIGYRVRFEDCSTPQTRILILTEALLMRELLNDPNLSEYGIVILDEFHERNLYTDAGLAALRELQLLNRPDLKIIIMSASLKPQPLVDYLQPAELLSVSGRQFPVEVHYDLQAQLLNTDRFFIQRVGQKILEALKTSSENRHILVFLPGLSEIQRVSQFLLPHPQWPKTRTLYLLHGSLSLQEQHKVLNNKGSKVILTTNVAETSLTIDGVDTVIDSGLARELQNDQRRLFPWLKTIRISKASAEQRKGRAGRQFPGRCYRLWSKLDENSLPAYSAPDILTQDLSELLIMLMALGISDPQSFSWFEKPTDQQWTRAQNYLSQLGLAEINLNRNYLTPKGKWIQNIPLSPRLASLIYDGIQLNKSNLALPLAVLLNEKDPWARENLESFQVEAQDSDLLPRLMALNQKSPPPEFQMHAQVLKQLARKLSLKLNPASSFSANEISQLLFNSFSDRIARRRKPKESTALTVGQKGVELSSQSLTKTAEFIFCLQGHANDSNGNAIVDLAHPLSKSDLLEKGALFIQLQKKQQYIPEKDTWMSVEQKYFLDLPIEEPNFKPMMMTAETLNLMVKESFSKWKQEVPELNQWFHRWHMAQNLWPEEKWPEISTIESEVIDMACIGESSLSAVKEKKWSELFCLLLTPNQKKLIQKELPESILSSRGRVIPLQYQFGEDAKFLSETKSSGIGGGLVGGLVSLELKIQDAFGWKETPQIAHGKIKIRLILLGPHGRPLQTTDDLSSFWKGTYLELRPTLKARYPKHPWPENPESFTFPEKKI